MYRILILLLLIQFLSAKEYKSQSIIIANDIQKSSQYHLGDFIIYFDYYNLSFQISHFSNKEKILWKSNNAKAFITGYLGKENVKESHGSFFIKDQIQIKFENQSIEEILSFSGKFQINGFLYGKNKIKKVPYKFILESISDQQLSFQIIIDSINCNRVSFQYYSNPDESIFGLGEQFTHFNLKGKKVPIFVSEQGIGRGKEPVTTIIDFIAKSGGNEFTSYAPIPHYISSNMTSIYLKNTEYIEFDFMNDSIAKITVFSNIINGGMIIGTSPVGIIEEYTKYSGRMKPLPDWVHNGAVIGLQGGTERVGSIVDKLLGNKIPISAVWIQDWVGQRKTSFGSQLWWNWELDANHYPRWDSLVTSLHYRNIKVLTYLNPFLTDVSSKTNYDINYYKYALDNKYFVMDSVGIPYDLDITTFSASLIDLTNPKARKWFKQIILTNMISLGVDGWMADFGEALPYYSKLYNGKIGSQIHNQYPVMWANLNKEIVEASDKRDSLIFFSRSGYTQSPINTSLFWLGDQLVTWDQYDGLKSSLTALLSSGLSGYAISHSDIGGYTAIKTPILKYIRSKELFMRWAEMNAFTAFFRTHEGNRPKVNHQVYSDNETINHFSVMANIYLALGTYRKKLMNESNLKGIPIVRHPFLHYPNDNIIIQMGSEQFMLGEEFMIAPVLNKSVEKIKCYLPKGKWMHLWSQSLYDCSSKGKIINVDAPIGSPAIFYKNGSVVGETLVSQLREKGILE